MKALQDKICREGRIEGQDIVKVDSFLNHQLDIKFLNEVGREFKRRFGQENITKILTVEASGIAVASVAAQYFDVPVVFAKKTASRNLDKETYTSNVFSFTRGTTYQIRVSKQYLHEADQVLIIDDFLAKGRAVMGLKEIIDQAKAHLVGVGIVIEKGFQPGGRILRESGVRVESLAIIDAMGADGFVFRQS